MHSLTEEKYSPQRRKGRKEKLFSVFGNSAGHACTGAQLARNTRQPGQANIQRSYAHTGSSNRVDT